MDIPLCSGIRAVPPHQVFHAADYSAQVNPANSPMRAPAMLAVYGDGESPSPLQIALLSTKYWGPAGVNLTVGFLEPLARSLRDRIIAYANKWSAYANVAFRYTTSTADADVRITTEQGGYWSYLGTDIKTVPPGEPTLCLQDWSASIPDAEWDRVIPHEIGHTLGCVHSQARKWIIDRLDFDRTLAWYMQTQGWSREMVIQQVLTPIDESQLMGTADPSEDLDSVMMYQFGPELTKDGRPIPGGSRITEADGRLMGRLYPKRGPKPPPPPEPPVPPPPPAAGLQPLLLGGPAVLVDVPAGGLARFLLILTAPVAFALTVGSLPSGSSDPAVRAGRKGGEIGIFVPTAAGWASIQAAAGEWEFRVKPVGLADGRPAKVWARAVGAGLGRSAEAAPMVLA